MQGPAAHSAASSRALSLPEELILMLLNEENGYFYQVPGWHLNCAVVAAVLAELSLTSRIDSDLESVRLVDGAETGDPALDPIIEEIAGESARHDAQYWIERLAPRAEPIIDLTLERLVGLRILQHHSGDFWTIAPTAPQAEFFSSTHGSAPVLFVKTRISEAVFSDEIPDTRDIIIICLIDTCDVFRFMFTLDEETEKRIDFICNMDLVGRSIADAVAHSLAGPLLRHSSTTAEIPKVGLRKLLLNLHGRDGNLPALLAGLAQEHGPVFRIDPPFSEPLIFLAGLETNRWAHRDGRKHLRARDCFSDFEKAYGASGVLPSLDGTDHFRLRKAMQPAYSRSRLAGHLDQLYRHARNHMAEWAVGDSLPAARMCRLMVNAQLSPLSLGIDSQDIIDDLMKYKERALSTHIVKSLPKFMLKTPGMRRRAAAVDDLLERVQSVHTPAQRAECQRDLADDVLSLHASDPQLVPESNLRFSLSAALIASVYLGDALSFAVYAMASQPELCERIRDEADTLFDGGDPDASDFSSTSIDVTRRFLMECLRLYPTAPVSMRHVMNSCLVEGHELPLGSRLAIAQTAAHYMDDAFPDPLAFDIDRYLPPRDEHRSPGYAPYGLGAHACLGSQWVRLQLAVNVLMIARYFEIAISPADYKLRFRPLPSMRPSKKLKFTIVGKRRALHA